MKVTVNFGPVRVIVPCGNGDLLVRDLVDLAITRYKKAAGKRALRSLNRKRKPMSVVVTMVVEAKAVPCIDLISD
ncbi:hypothetical protein MRX96_004776 [Rhipicephalus microplus]